MEKKEKINVSIEHNKIEQTELIYVIDDNNNGFWKNEIDTSRYIYNPLTDVYHTKRNYSDYHFLNCRTNPRNK